MNSTHDYSVPSVIKKDRTTESFDVDKIKKAIRKSAHRINVKLTEEDENEVVGIISSIPFVLIEVAELHSRVEGALLRVNENVAKSYRDYRNYKKDNSELMDKVFNRVQYSLYEVDRENSNSNSRLISTKRVAASQELAIQIYKKYHLSQEQRIAIKKGYIYIHDLSDRIFGMINCCLFDLENILKGGFQMSNTFYKEPNNIRTAIDQTRAIIMCASSQQYGGFTIPEIDKTLGKYCEMSYQTYREEIKLDILTFNGEADETLIDKMAKAKTYRDLQQRMQGMEAELNDIVSARGSFPFTTFTFGDGETYWEQQVSRAILEVRMAGHGKTGHKKNQIFPKLVFLYSERKHKNGAEYQELMDLAVKCSSKCMYPDYISESAYKRSGAWVSPMGCRAYLSDYSYEGKNRFVGRFNLGACSLNLPMIYAKSKRDNTSFYAELDKNLQLIREVHQYTVDYMGKMKASSNPLGFIEGGFLGGSLKMDESIKPLLKSATASFGITALNELCILVNKNSIYNDNSFANDVMDYINKKVEDFKKEDDILYAIYGTPAESLCQTQARQFKEEFGFVHGISTEYFTNSFHCHVAEEINPFDKQDAELKLFNKHKGGHIQYVRISQPDNLNGLRSVIERGLNKGFYQGVNFNACTCEECGSQGIDFEDTCPSCGSNNITEINRITGYLGYSRIKSDRTMNDGIMANIRDRKSM